MEDEKTLSTIREKAFSNNLNSLTRIAIEGPVSVADKLEISLQDSVNLCEIACKKLERDNLVPPSCLTAQEFLIKRQNLPRISTGCQQLDKLLFGGIESGSLTEIFGGPGSGKTQLCFTLCINLNKYSDGINQQLKTIFIDTENKFRPERLEQIAIARGCNPKILEDIWLMKPLNTSQLDSLLTKALNMIEKDSSIRLLILDSLVSLHRSEYTGRKNLLERQNRIAGIMKLLVKASTVYNVVVVITNQTQSSVDMDWVNKLMPVGGNVIGHMSTYRLELKKRYRHVATMVNSPYHEPSEARFMISEKGITDCSSL